MRWRGRARAERPARPQDRGTRGRDADAGMVEETETRTYACVNRPIKSTPLFPPNPKEFDITMFRFAFLAVLGT